MHFLIYKITNNINGKRYIGAHSTSNKNDGYMGSGKLIKRAIKKYGIGSFTKEIMAELPSEEMMFLTETVYIKELKPEYNLHEGGNGGWKYVNGSKLNGGSKRSFLTDPEIANKARTNSTVTIKNNMKNESYKKWWIKQHKTLTNSKFTMLGKTHSEETKQRIGRVNALKQQGSKNSQYGTCWITNGKENRKIKKETLDIWLKKGYNRGRIYAVG